MRNGYVLDWILEASRLIREAQEADPSKNINGDIWHARADRVVRDIHKVKPPEVNNNG